jgi:hypothetical protein
MVSKPLGDYEPFRRWSGKPRAWGPEGAGWRAWFGGKVVDGLCDVLDEHLAAPRRSGRFPAAVGCVPWLTSKAVAKRLLALSSYCVVVDKGLPNKGQRAYRTASSGSPITRWKGALREATRFASVPSGGLSISGAVR